MLNQVLLDKENLLQKLGKFYRKGKFYVYLSFYGIEHDRENDVVSIASEIRLALRQMPKALGMILMNDYFEIKQANW